MNYQKIYDQIIDRARKEQRAKKQGTYYEIHHILPRCMGGSNKKENLILLTAREHFLAHWMLVRIYPEGDKLSFAFWAMCNQKNKGQEERYLPSSRTYREARELHSKTITATLTAFYQTQQGVESKGKQTAKLKVFNQTVEGKEARAKALLTLKQYYQTEEGIVKQATQTNNLKAYYKTNKGIELRAAKAEKLKIPVYQYSTGGEFLKKWPSQKEAGETLGIQPGNISSCCRSRQKTSGGFIWKYD